MISERNVGCEKPTGRLWLNGVDVICTTNDTHSMAFSMRPVGAAFVETLHGRWIASDIRNDLGV